MKRTMIAMLLSAGMASMQAQWMETGNFGLNAVTNFLGNTDAVPMNIRTEDIRRFRLNYDEVYAIGPFGGQVKNGSLLLSPVVDQFYGNGAPGPYSLLHLAAANNNAQEGSYRPWMNTGITLTGNADHQYIGQKAGELDYTDLVIHWSDNPGEFLKDRLRFIFTSGYDAGAASGAQSTEGLEFMRFFPDRYENPLIGIGDFYAANLADPTITEPTERVDLLNGRLRIRQLPTSAPMDTLYRFMVVDQTGVVHWRNIPPGTLGCEWDQVIGPNH